MPGWVKVAEKVNDAERELELELEDNGTLLLENIRNVFNDATTLKYKNPENNAWRVVKCVNDVLHPPKESGWGTHVYIPVIAKGSEHPKISESSPNEDELESLLPFLDSEEEVKQEPKMEEKIQIVDSSQKDNNNNGIGKKNRSSSRIKGQSFIVKNIVKCEENETIKMCLKKAQTRQSVVLEKCGAMSLKKAQKRKSTLLEECNACKKFLTHNYMKDHNRRLHDGAN